MSPAAGLLVTKGQNISLSLFLSSGVFRRTRRDKTHHSMNRRQPFLLQHYWTRRAKLYRLSSAESCWPFARLHEVGTADACSARTSSVLLSLATLEHVAFKILTTMTMFSFWGDRDTEYFLLEQWEWAFFLYPHNWSWMKLKSGAS